MSRLRQNRLAPRPSPPPVVEHRSPPFELTLQEVAPGGDAVGRRDDGLVVFVPGGTPGDRVQVRLHSQRRSFARGELLRVISPGPGRVEAPCLWAVPQSGQGAAACGGCPLMALSRPAQLEAKQAWVQRALRQISVTVRPIVAPAADQGYRLRARLVVRDGHLSFAAAGSHRGVDLSACLILDPALEHVLLRRCRSLASQLGEGGVLLGLVGQQQGQPIVHLAVELGCGGSPAAVLRALTTLWQDGAIGGAIVNAGSPQEQVIGQPHVDLSVPTETGPNDDDLGPLFGSAAGFAQACAAGHLLLPRLVAQAVREPFSDGTLPDLPQPQIVELYAGSGNLTRALVPLARQLVCVEGDARALARAAARFGAGLQVVADSVETALLRLKAAGARPTTVVLDPPRAGARDAMSLLADLQPRRVVYVSCDVMTLARDLALLSAHGYRPRHVQPIDLMPHTAEVECVAVCDADPAA